MSDAATLPPRSLSGLRGAALGGATLGALVATGLTVKYLAQSLDGQRNFDLGGFLFVGAVLLLPLTPFVAVAAAAYRRPGKALLIACLAFEALALPSCWYYAQLAFRLTQPDALESLTFLFLPVYQCAALSLCLGVGAAWQAWRTRP